MGKNHGRRECAELRVVKAEQIVVWQQMELIRFLMVTDPNMISFSISHQILTLQPLWTATRGS